MGIKQPLKVGSLYICLKGALFNILSTKSIVYIQNLGVYHGLNQSHRICIFDIADRQNLI